MKLTSILAVAICFSICTAKAEDAPSPENVNNLKTQAAVTGNQFILVTKESGKWMVVSIGDTRPERSSGQEILLYPGLMPAYEGNGEYSYIGTYYALLNPGDRLKQKRGDNIYECKVGASKGYTPCTTTLTKFIDTDFFGLSGKTRFDFVPQRLAQIKKDIASDPKMINHEYHASFPKEESVSMLQQWLNRYKGQYDPNNLVPDVERRLVEAISVAERMAASKKYHDDFNQAKTSASLGIFISQYEGKFDPEGLIPRAKELKINAIKTEKAAQKIADEENRQREISRKKNEEEEKIRLVSFRKSLKFGDETNCGPVLESKGPLTKISFAVANYGNEHWIRTEQIFPPGYGCRFLNGQYLPPL